MATTTQYCCRHVVVTDSIRHRVHCSHKPLDS